MAEPGQEYELDAPPDDGWWQGPLDPPAPDPAPEVQVFPQPEPAPVVPEPAPDVPAAPAATPEPEVPAVAEGPKPYNFPGFYTPPPRA
jgi:hypothetical protein